MSLTGGIVGDDCAASTKGVAARAAKREGVRMREKCTAKRRDRKRRLTANGG